MSTISGLPLGYALEQDQDGDWVLSPPENITIFSCPGEGLLIGTCDRDTALADALAYLSTMSNSRNVEAA